MFDTLFGSIIIPFAPNAVGLNPPNKVGAIEMFFGTAFGDGIYPVYAVYGDDGVLVKVEVLFTDYEEDDVNLDL